MSKFFKEITNRIIEVQTKANRPIIVSVSGVDGAGKTFFAKTLVSYLSLKNKPIISASVDKFHNPKNIRYQKGSDSPEGFYYDSYNYIKMNELLIMPFKNQRKECVIEYFDCENDRKIVVMPIPIHNNSILVLEGIFLFRP